MQKLIYVNNAASAFPLAPGVVEAMTGCMEKPPCQSGRDTSGKADELLECRETAMRLMALSSGHIVLTPGATYALNLAILGMDLKAGDVVISSVMEHNSVLRPLARLEDLAHITVRYVPLDRWMALDPVRYEQFLLEKPRLVVLSHGSNVTGRINPIAEWFQKAKATGALTLLDAGQTMGRIPVHPQDLHADMVVFPGHKGLRGPLGTGVLYVGPGVNLVPLITGGTGVKSELRLQPEGRLEAGTPNTPAFAGLTVAMRYHLEHRQYEAEYRLATHVMAALVSLPRIQVFDPEAIPRLPIVSFTIKGMTVEDAGFALSESFNIRCRTGLHCAPLIHRYLGSLPEGTIRYSPSLMTSPEDLHDALEAVRSLGESC
ncbi:MAG: aminotransferase class V-fold PLP-dependent enzyme [Treponema sp.]|jgi:selenocysteine lyase/cysteine desulfurase|nr:aminotransferase class V-fold PLP-dependent enzyme [Treponema sp.]